MWVEDLLSDQFMQELNSLTKGLKEVRLKAIPVM